MKRSPGEKEQDSLLSPSRFSAEGFLGNDKRSIEDIVTADAATVESLGTTVQDIAEKLTNVFNVAESALGNSVTIAPDITATHYEARGKTPSPFRGDGVFQKGEVVVTFSASGKSLIITRLGINLIAKHRFFQGIGSRYRIEPDVAATLLNV